MIQFYMVLLCVYEFCRLMLLSTSSEDQSDLSDLELIQHLNVDVIRLTKLLSGKLYSHVLFFFSQQGFFHDCLVSWGTILMHKHEQGKTKTAC